MKNNDEKLQSATAAFGPLWSTFSSIRQRDDGTYPLGVALLELKADPLIALHLAPPPKSSQSLSHSTPSGQWRSQP